VGAAILKLDTDLMLLKGWTVPLTSLIVVIIVVVVLIVICRKGPRHNLAHWLSVPDNKLNMPNAYQSCYIKYTRSDAITNFKCRENLVPWNLLLWVVPRFLDIYYPTRLCGVYITNKKHISQGNVYGGHSSFTFMITT